MSKFYIVIDQINKTSFYSEMDCYYIIFDFMAEFTSRVLRSTIFVKLILCSCFAIFTMSITEEIRSCAVSLFAPVLSSADSYVALAKSIQYRFGVLNFTELLESVSVVKGKRSRSDMYCKQSAQRAQRVGRNSR